MRSDNALREAMQNSCKAFFTSFSLTDDFPCLNKVYLLLAYALLI